MLCSCLLDEGDDLVALEHVRRRVRDLDAVALAEAAADLVDLGGIAKTVEHDARAGRWVGRVHVCAFACPASVRSQSRRWREGGRTAAAGAARGAQPASAVATPRPMPLVEPVTIAVFPFSAAMFNCERRT